MRRLPVYLLVDTSGSMMGEAIEAVRNGLQMLVSALRQDPYALETAYLSVITFDSHAKQVTPLTELMSFQMPDIQASGVTAMGEALTLLADCINREVQKGSAEVKGDWKPVVFLLSDGLPTDDLQKGINAIHQVKTGTFVACAAGAGADTNVLKQITETVVSLDTADANSIKAFFKWVSASISVSSQKVDLNKKDVGGLNELPPPPAELNIVL
ncbi:VWA domain-containing protein [Glaesserella parasuis]|uniref:vWA domain-containing protein n=1 Tax=Glaesserella parasuis TaxID=738 RepID=UPI0003ABD34C|nr:VWA domain-containing protein [Glaesserella parasuis]ATW43857.1 tellerium resistance protein TerY [Glaesserella parasuis D74]EQA11747.1 von Willebrand factor type A domain protein [Glaesserella parasuis D74]MDE4014952.1 VWA domain-containing protein [Glaesserella parasuis]MDP0317570.1 VWA domain-containing protein [Glaesserella parasuis]